MSERLSVLWTFLSSWLFWIHAHLFFCLCLAFEEIQERAAAYTIHDIADEDDENDADYQEEVEGEEEVDDSDASTDEEADEEELEGEAPVVEEEDEVEEDIVELTKDAGLALEKLDLKSKLLRGGKKIPYAAVEEAVVAEETA